MNKRIVVFVFLLLNIFLSTIFFFGEWNVARGEYYKKAGDFKNALKKFKRASKFCPLNYRPLYYIGYLLYKKGVKSQNSEDLFNAYKYLQKSQMCNPGYYRSLLLICEIKERLKIGNKTIIENLTELNKRFPDNLALEQILKNEIENQRNSYFIQKKIKIYWNNTFGEPGRFLNKNQLIQPTKEGNLKNSNGILYSNGRLFGLLHIEGKKGQIIVSAKSTSAEGVFAKMTVFLNHRILGSIFVNTIKFQDYIFPYESKFIGNKVVSVSFDNDFYRGPNSEQRDLYINYIKVH